MATIKNTGDACWEARFNKRNLIIKKSAHGVVATDNDTGEFIEGGELRSVQSLLEWHIRSNRASSELMTVATIRGGRE